MKSRANTLAAMYDIGKHRTIAQFEFYGDMADAILENHDVDIEITKHNEKRSKDANAKYWKLVGELSKAVNRPAELIYKEHIRDISNYETLMMLHEAVPEFSKKWCSNHLGRFVDTRKSNKDWDVVLAYYGSSDFNRAEMSRLIDNCIQDCKAVGVPTDNPAEIKRLLEMWGGK